VPDTDTGWNRIKDILEQLQPLDPAQRSALLRDVYAVDTDLRRRIEQLLERYDSALGFFAQFPDLLTDSSEERGSTRTFSDGTLVAERFRILRLLGRGGMGEVYAAQDSKLRDEPLALKTLRVTTALDEAAVGRLTEELRLARRITHPNVCRVHDVYQHKAPDGRQTSFFTMELLEGETLAARLSRGKMSTGQALPVVKQIAAAIDAAHAADVAHGDLKPGNVMLVPSRSDGDRAVVTDFGLARFLPSVSSLVPTTRTTVRRGTPIYMAPEQLMGGPLTHAADIYALGVVCFEMVVGRPPFGSDSPLLLALRKVRQTPGALRSLSPDLDARWAAVIVRCLDVRPERRFRFAGDVVRELESPQRRLVWMGATAAAVGVGVVTGLLRMATPTGLPAGGGEQTLAVLPFTQDVRTPEGDALALGLTAAVTERLSTTLRKPNAPSSVTPASEVIGTGVNTPALAQQILGVSRTLSARFLADNGPPRIVIGFNEESSQIVDLKGSRVVDVDRDDRPLTDRVTLAMLDLLRERQATSPAPTAQGSHTVEVERAYLRGRGYVLQGPSHLEEAIAALQQVVQQDDRFSQAHRDLGEAYLEQYIAMRVPDALGRAQSAIDRALLLDPEDARTRVIAGRIYLTNSQPKRAVLELKTALGLDPDVPDGRNRLAAAFEADGDVAAAEDEYRRAVSLHPKHWSGYEDFGNFLYAHGRFDEAEQAYVQGSAYAPLNRRAIQNLSAVYMIQERFAAAEHELTKGLAEFPDGLMYNNLAWVYILQADFETAVITMRDAVKLPRADAGVWSSLARACRWSGAHRAEGREAYDRALALAVQELRVNPLSADLRSNYAYLLAETHRERESLDELTKALRNENAAGNTTVVFRSALVRELLHDRSGALKALERAARAGFPRSRIQRDPDLRELRKDPAYRRIGEVAGWEAK
jgi:eukaryotic-like serine/threonine-protein kinase